MAVDSRPIADIVGPVAAREFDAAKDVYKRTLLEWALRLPSLSDARFLTECRGSTLYAEAHARVMREHRYTPSPTAPCTCRASGHR
ncbi:hypothetical protein [Thermomonospora umbrina]|uniref:Uncharacterized protein n=1 Tax=Thermomonospora umbrina TaxID=111806 RepID=A0A3D9SWP4_9ACTN|nr:hypothetical protein [Thermomonospora umbrina]REF00373.1 hypothetical protein DFJ69_5905 [Thermomonospora umbrina]